MDEEGKTGFSSYADALWWGVVRQLNLNEMETHCLEEASPSLMFSMRTSSDHCFFFFLAMHILLPP